LTVGIENGTSKTVNLGFLANPVFSFGKVNADGTSAGVVGADNITKNGTGDYTISFNTTRSNTSYVIQLTIVDSNGAGNDDYDISYSNQTVNGFVVHTGDNDNGGGNRAPRDSEFMFTVMDY